MPAIQDFRTLSRFTLEDIEKSGTGIGRSSYSKLYALENYYRVLINSILIAQSGRGWWALAVDQNIQNKVNGFKVKYLSSPWHTSPGAHDIYYTDVYDLNEIARANAHLFRPIVPDIDQWISKIEAIRLPRNVVAHMNFPNKTDRKRIDVLFEDFRQLMSSLNKNSIIVLSIP